MLSEVDLLWGDEQPLALDVLLFKTTCESSWEVSSVNHVGPSFVILPLSGMASSRKDEKTNSTATRGLEPGLVWL